MLDIDVGRFLMGIVPLLFAITLHEMAHGWMAKQCGDNTAFMLGRITLNPIKHIDLIGTIILPLVLFIGSNGTFTFGWAKPVPINPRAFKNYRRDTCLVAFAGPAVNFIMAMMWAFIIFILYQTIGSSFVKGSVHHGLFMMAFFGVWINLMLAVFNLLPIPPLDGGRIMVSVLPYPWSLYLSRLEPYGLIIVMALAFTQVLFKLILPVITFLQNVLLFFLN